MSASASDSGLTVLVLDGATLGTNGLDRSDDLVGLDIAIGDAAKHDVLAVKPGGNDGSDEKLRAVAVPC